MAEDNNYTNAPQLEEEMEIDLMEYARKLWANRMLLLKIGGIAALVGVLIALGTPKVYTVNVTLAPEASSGKRSSMSSIASMLGVGGMSASEADALNISLYPDIVASTPFIIDLLDTPVQTIDEKMPETTLTEHIKQNKKSWLGIILSLPSKAIAGIKSLFIDKEEESTPETINPFHLTFGQASSVNGLRRMISVTTDKKTGVTVLSVTMQDPMVAAIVTDTVLVKLKEHIINYRVSKAQEDCKYYEKLYNESKQKYYEAQKNYANFVDANKNLILKSAEIESDRLQNEMNLAFSIYNEMAGQLQMGLAKIQEAKPMFTVVEPSSVPLLPSGTSSKMIVVGTVFLALVAGAAWILFGQELLANMKKGMEENKKS